MSASATDERFMRLALAVGVRNLGSTWPNPSVGAVVVRDEGGNPLIVAQGVTEAGGRPHAERVALGLAGEAAKGATLYVTLEPCSHHGKSPPCVDAVIASGVARVVSAIEDPDDRVAGEGHALLRQAGIAVDVGCLAEQARRDHRGHITRVTKGRPAITVKLARTTEGFAGSRSGERLMITGELSNARVHMMRAHADAIMVGAGTVLADDPLLNVRLPGLEDRSPIRVVIDSHLRMPVGAMLVAGAREIPTWIVTTIGASVEAEKRLVESGVEVLRVETDSHGHVDLAQAMQLLGTRGLTRVFSEGGPGLADALARADLIDELVLFTGRSVRGQGDVTALGPALQDKMDELRLIGDEMLGPDLLMFWEKV
ncbi:bifunctional diaminohydroxyphosphoribosylaminopyrimidine deaminase/5-amino-6-(5-phosphoribosylamino)uracil reductase RibD [Microvirga sp. 2MCAF38]|uniref:bifunctional diaminohydroxyphosphoribosylaminopyrimidine deaminase/5-amino-6-(5-phosphoribosylamino)uracil reductase RibD n=1 Tax=Microvirga sp. 2MCAF38 TaxID=3232989 RepID=UPI003F9ABD00